MTFEVKDYQLPQAKKVSGYVERLNTEHPDVRTVYNRFSSVHHAAMIRNDLAWDEYWRWDLDELTAAVYYDGLIFLKGMYCTGFQRTCFM